MIRRFFNKKPKIGGYGNVFLHFACYLLFFLMFQPHIKAAHALKFINLQTVNINSSTRIIAVFNAKPNFHLEILNKPTRLVINLPIVDFSTQNKSPSKKNILSDMLLDVHYDFSDTQASRIIFTSKTTFSIKNSRVEKLNNGLWQILIDITQSSQKDFNEALKNQQKIHHGIKTRINPENHFRVVLDPGHGGVDSGARGITGILEKNITLIFARALRDELEKDSNIHVILTRDSDEFLRLSERVKKTQDFNADLFISIHADSIKIRSLRGATVYTLSEKASDTIAKSLADHENKVDFLDGLIAEEIPEVTDILIDLTRRETQMFSIDFADRVILNLLKSKINLINNPHRYADFLVLKASDIPSILIEIGYLSNKEDEKLLNDSQWREKMVIAIANSIRQFAADRQKTIQSL
ncbi:N-acetylmuramoyl-L-alanine amidase family protein [Bartonella sp. Raccoon60]|uniref:N-acetylmuramoyl-L-alanine amidase family protein n=1 Tax=Bartonella sp. Raccoon60 TaxID=1933912 RepID=UPI000999F2F5|nr:N-acetylmuramoyl-L-alanine amidase [Bartonella sp. Raccoon60]AQX26621.1 N-acetylmuramoyl-L-alanine amidase [Bartonella sp. Raccoon60]